MVVEFSLVPVGAGEELAGPVAEVIDLVDRSGLAYRVTAMGTLVEGGWDEVFDLIKRCHRRMRRSAGRVLTRISVDDRAGARNRLEGKVGDVERVLGRPVSRG